MIPVLRKTWSRLTQMSWNELQTRLGQELNKRLDVAMYQVGFRPAGNWLQGRSTKTGKFFFTADDLPLLNSLLQEHLSEEVESIIREADEICHHRFHLLGYAGLTYGSDIDWHLDVVHGKRAPLKPWFKIPFLDFAEVGDHKVTWELNRHQHFVTLAKAWRLTQQERYVTELIQQWYAWQRANPYPLGINWGSSLEVAFRSLSWLWVLRLIAGCRAVPAAFETDLSRALALNGRHIERYLSTYFSPNTHLLGEAVALFFIGTLCPRLSASKRWRKNGWRIVLEEAGRQVRPDGVYFEQSLYYHVYALDFFLHARVLAGCNQMEIPSSFDQTLEKMLQVVQAVSQVGPPEGFGDDDGGRVFNPRRNRAEHLTDPLAIGATLFGHDDLKSAATLTEEALWLFGERAVSWLDKRSFTQPMAKPKSKSFEAGGIYTMAGCDPIDGQLVIDAGPQGTGHSGHGHADALSVRVSLDGERWLIDPGTYCYVSADNERDQFRGTGAHNTLRIDGLDQAVPQGPFAWNLLPRVRAESWQPGTTFTLFAGSHTGYSRLPDPVLHRRFVFHLHGGFWLVRDVAEGRDVHQLETFWHFAPDLRVLKDGSAFIATPSPSPHEMEKGNGTRLALLSVEEPGWDSELVSGQVSPAYGRKEPAPLVRFSAQAQLPAEFVVMLLPLHRTSKRLGKLIEVGAKGPPSGSVRTYRYDGQDKTHYMIFADCEELWGLGSWTSDARFLYFGLEGRRVTHLIMCGGSFVKLQGEPIVIHHRRVERFEWLSQAGTCQIFSSDEAAVHSPSEAIFESCDAVF